MMKLKTIINTTWQGSLAGSLMTSVVTHACVIGFCVSLHGRFEVAERFTKVLSQPHLTTLDRFVTVTPQPVESKPVAAQEPAVAQAEPAPQVKPAPTKRRVKRRSKRRIKRKLRSAKPKAPSPQRVAKRSEAPASKSHESALASHTERPSVSTKLAVASTANIALKAAHIVQRRLSRVELRGLQRGYYSELNQLMRRERSYPRSARRQGLEGTVLVELIVDARGKLLSASVVRSSGHEVLDRAALADVKKMKRLPSPPSELKRRRVKLHIPFEYSLQS